MTGGKHRDHCHVTGVYRGPAHASCNLNCHINAEKIEVPCFLHNMKNYDAHLIISAATKEHGEITAIPSNSEKYISLSIGEKLKKVTFKDTYAFMNASLDTLVNDLKSEELVNTRHLEMEEIRKRDMRETYYDSDISISSEDYPDTDHMSFNDDGDDVPRPNGRHYQFDDSDDGDEVVVSLIFIFSRYYVNS